MQPRVTVVGPNASAATRSTLIRLDPWAGPVIGVQCGVSGTVNYTLEQSFDDPNDPVAPVAVGSMKWVNCPDLNLVGATATQQTYYPFCPTFISVVINSGAGSVTMTVSQSASVTY